MEIYKAGCWPKFMMSALALCCSASIAQAAVPMMTPLQGVLRDNAGTLVGQGAFAVEFALYDAPEALNPIWTESWPPGGGDCVDEPAGCVPVHGGVFRVALGTHSPLTVSLFAAGPLWLGVSVEGEPELPRRALGSSPYATYAAAAGGLDCTGCVGLEALSPEALQALQSIDEAALPATGLDEVSNGLLTTEFVHRTENNVPVPILDEYPLGVGSHLVVPEVGTARAVRVSIDITNSDLSTLTLSLYTPLAEVGKVILWEKNGPGTHLVATYPTPDAPVSGDLSILEGKSPAGTWVLHALDEGSPVEGHDGAIVSWSVEVDTLSDSQVAVQGDLNVGGDASVDGDLTVGGAITGPGGIVVGPGGADCDAAHAGAIHYDPGSQRLFLCTGSELLQLKACSTECLQPTEVSCGEEVTDSCGSSCGGQGIALNTVQCLGKVSTTPCNVEVLDGCGNPCGLAGSALDVAGCPTPEEVACGNAIADPCGNLCQGTGTSCGAGYVCTGEGCAGPGTSAELPGLSCAAIVATGTAGGDGRYWIDPDAGGAGAPFEAWCDMTHDGGGWTLVMRMAPDGGLGYGAGWWTNEDTFDDDPSGQMDPTSSVNAKFASYNLVEGTEVRGCRGAHDGCLSMDMDGTKTLRSLMNGGAVSANFPRADFVSLFGDDSSQPNCNQSGLNQSWTYAGYRFGFVGNNENDCSSCDAAWGWGVYGGGNQGKDCGAGLAPHTAGEQCVHGSLWVR
ncbi:MAG: fibrinogen-like YCDxxxxGGGW domain-containing protein [Myxococcota bacterium]|nr:fibrinogen-like YCDxxxxGGGW domain-containing protein [Myxococcota bacterium]